MTTLGVARLKFATAVIVGTFLIGACGGEDPPATAATVTPTGVSEAHYPAVAVDVDALLPTVRTTYRYDGSLTPPPCSEAVSWIVRA